MFVLATKVGIFLNIIIMFLRSGNTSREIQKKKDRGFDEVFAINSIITNPGTWRSYPDQPVYEPQGQGQYSPRGSDAGSDVIVDTDRIEHPIKYGRPDVHFADTLTRGKSNPAEGYPSEDIFYDPGGPTESNYGKRTEM